MLPILLVLVVPATYVAHLIASTVVHYRREYRISKLTSTERLHALRDLTTSVCRALDGVDYWIDYGTLLGVIRDGDVLPWDSDVDVTVPIEALDDAYHQLEQRLPARYSVVRCAVGRPCHTIHEAIWSPWWRFHQLTGLYRLLVTDSQSGLNCDVMRTVSPDPSTIHQNRSLPSYKVERADIFPLQHWTLAGQHVNVPHRPETLLERIYGEDWRTPTPPFWYDQ